MKDRYRFVLLFAAALASRTAFCGQQPVLNGPSGRFAASEAITEAQPVTEPGGELQTERREIAEKVRVAQRTLDSANETSKQSNAKAPVRLQREVDLLKQLDVTLAQLEAAKSQQAELQARLSDLMGQLEAVREIGPSEERPYSFLLLDHLRDELAARQSRTETLQAAAANTQQAVTRAKETLDARQQAARRAKELERTNAEDTKKAELAIAVKIADLEVRLANQLLSLRQQEHANENGSQQIHQAEIQLLEEKIKWISKVVVFSRRDLQDQLVEIDKLEADLKGALRTAEFNLRYAESELVRLRQQLDASTTKQASLVEQVEAGQLARQYHQQQVALLNARLERLGMVRQIWNRRHAVITESAETDELITWGEETQTWVDQL